MIISTKELLEKYKDYKVPKMKIKNEVNKGTYIKVNRGLYETNKDVEPSLLASYIKSPSYLSFEYALSIYGLIPEATYTYTSATCMERHTYNYQNYFGRYSFRDIPKKAFAYGIINKEINGYSYNIATKEKALCDLIAVSKPLKNKKELYSYLFDSLRIDESIFISLDFNQIIELTKLYDRKNTKLLGSLVKEYKNGKHHY